MKKNKANENISTFTNTYNSKKYDLFFTPVNKNRKKKLFPNMTNVNQSEDLINSVKKIFLYNSKNKAETENAD